MTALVVSQVPFVVAVRFALRAVRRCGSRRESLCPLSSIGKYRVAISFLRHPLHCVPCGGQLVPSQLVSSDSFSQVPFELLRSKLGFFCEVEPVSGIEPDPPVYESGARPIELRGQVPAVRARGSPARRSARRRRQRSLVVRPSDSAMFFAELVPINERLDQLGYRPASGGPSRIRTGISRCVYDRVQKTNGLQRKESNLRRRQGMAEPCCSSNALKYWRPSEETVFDVSITVSCLYQLG